MMVHTMHNAFPFYVAAFIAVAVLIIGCSYLVAPEKAVGSFGLKLPALDPDTRAWLRLKGIRDVTLGLLVLTLMATAEKRVVGITLLVSAIVPFGDMSIILASGGSKMKAFSIHGVTCAVILIVGLLLLHAR